MESNDIRQVIVVRKDLEMPRGKMAAQAAHASLGALFKFQDSTELDPKTQILIDLKPDSPINKWINGSFTKIVVEVNSEEELLKIEKKAIKKGLKAALITDAGFTVFDKPTITCLGIGPATKRDFNGVSNHLKLYTDEG